ncbi:MAG: DNA-processing protein DprA [Planctomycetia bacterium]
MSDCVTLSDCNERSSDRVASVALSLATGIGPRLQASLLSRFGSCRAVLSQPKQMLLQVEGIGEKTADAILDAQLLHQADEMILQCSRLGVEILLHSEDAGYPRRLREICDAPQVIYRRGMLLPQDELAVAIVGARRCSTYGRRHAERLAAQLSRAGLTIVSGLARGIDLAAHQGALTAGGRTLAVLPGGVTTVYPPEHDKLAQEISEQGAVLSEMPLNQRILPGLFPQRNRVISGLSLGVIVIEAARNSGALYTARHALEQGREVLALPGPVDSLASAGCHELIRDGVTLVRHADDVLEALGPLPGPANPAKNVTVHTPRELNLNAIESAVLNQITLDPVSIDEVLRTTRAESSQVLATLTVLEVRRLIRRLPGNFVVRYS